jgi:prepilin-type N-terminal cleavage/methylation domain-containing protein
MRQRIRAIRENENGFTLTELLIVIVILGVLTGIVVFAVNAFTDRGTQAACKSDRKAIEVAVEAYRAQEGSYPAAGDIAILVTKGYLREQPSNNGYTVSLAAGGAVTGVMGNPPAVPAVTC